MREMRIRCWHKKILIIIAVSALFVWLSNMEIVSRGTGTSSATVISKTTRNLWSIYGLEGKRSTAAEPDLDLHYYSKRTVPKGPDPIHNRKAGKSREPTGRV